MLLIVGLILISLLLAIGFLWAFIWAVRTGQFDDTDTPASRMLFENKPMPEDQSVSNHD